MDKEVWKDIPGYEGLYKVSNLGDVLSLKRGEYKLKQGTDNYKAVTIFKKGFKPKRFLVHRLIAQTFIPNPDNKPQVNHKNGIKRDNRIENLEWVTEQENVQHSWKNGLQKTSENHHLKKNHFLKGKFGKDNYKTKPICQYNMNGDFIKMWWGTREINRELGFNARYISKCLANKYKHAYGYIWKHSLNAVIKKSITYITLGLKLKFQNQHHM